MARRVRAHARIGAGPAGLPRRITVFVFKKNSCVYDFVHVAPPAAPAEGRREFVAFVQGFSTLSP